MGMASGTAEPCREYCDNGEEIFDKFFFGGSLLLIENRDSPMGESLDDSFEDFKIESTESVFAGNHNFFDIPSDSFVQNGIKSLSF